jgi:hypothetical protein
MATTVSMAQRTAASGCKVVRDSVQVDVADWSESSRRDAGARGPLWAEAAPAPALLEMVQSCPRTELGGAAAAEGFRLGRERAQHLPGIGRGLREGVGTPSFASAMANAADTLLGSARTMSTPPSIETGVSVTVLQVVGVRVLKMTSRAGIDWRRWTRGRSIGRGHGRRSRRCGRCIRGSTRAAVGTAPLVRHAQPFVQELAGGAGRRQTDGHSRTSSIVPAPTTNGLIVRDLLRTARLEECCTLAIRWPA